MGKAKRKKVIGEHYFAMDSGKASPSSMYGVIGYTLGNEGVDVQNFCDQFNARTAFSTGCKYFIVMTYDDGSFRFDLSKDYRERLVNHHGIPNTRRPPPRWVIGVGTANQVVGSGFISRSASSWRAINQSQRRKDDGDGA